VPGIHALEAHKEREWPGPARPCNLYSHFLKLSYAGLA
jgi:hypothetical protein